MVGWSPGFASVVMQNIWMERKSPYLKAVKKPRAPPPKGPPYSPSVLSPKRRDV